MPLLSVVDLNGVELATLRPTNTTSDDPVVCSQFDIGSPNPRESVQERAGVSGNIDLTAFHGPRVVTADLRLRTINGVTKEQSLAVLSDLSGPRKRYYIHIQRDGWLQPRRMLVRASALTCVSNRESAAFFTANMSWICPSGEMEALELTAAGIIPHSSSTSVQPLGLSFIPTGFTPPALYPGWVSWGEEGVAFSAGSSSGASSSASVNVVNDGNTDTPLTMKIFGQCTNPVIINVTTGQTLAFTNLTIVDTAFVQVDADTRTVTDNSAQSVYSTIDWTRSSWWGLAPGTNTIIFQASDMGTACHLELLFRAKWI